MSDPTTPAGPEPVGDPAAEREQDPAASSQAAESQAAGPQAPGPQAPPNDGAQAPQAPPVPSSGVPPIPQYGAPQAPQGAPTPAPQYGASPIPPYGVPAGSPYGAPQGSPYGAPQGPAYGAPQFAPAPQPWLVLPPPGPGEPFDGAADPADLTRPLYGATIGQAFLRLCRSYARFSGRASRSEFWWAYLIMGIASLLPWAIVITGFALESTFRSRAVFDSGPGSALPAWLSSGDGLIGFGFVLAILVWLALVVPRLAITWRRFQDAGYPGPLAFIWLVGIIPYIGWIGQVLVLVFMMMPPKPEGRRFEQLR